jgi:hypothetical protein
MSSHAKADYQILLDNASSHIESHASSSGLRLLPLVWDEGTSGMVTTTHRLRIATRDAHVDLQVPHQWLALDVEEHNRFRTEVAAALARLVAAERETHA